MKKFIKYFMAVLVAVTIFCFSALPVSALSTVTFDIPFDFYNDTSLSDDTVKTIYGNIYKNQSLKDLGYTSENSTLCISYVNNTITIYIQKTDIFVNVGGGCVLNLPNNYHYVEYSFINNSNNISDLSLHSFSETYLSAPSSGVNLYYLPVFDGSYEKYFIAYLRVGFYGSFYIELQNGYSDFNPDKTVPLAFFHNYLPSFNPVINPLYRYNYSLNVNKEKFTKWLVDTGKYKEIAEELVESRVSGLVGVFAEYGGNNSGFIDVLKKYFKFISISQYIDDYGSVVNKIRSLYQEFQKQEKDELMDIFFHRTEKTDNIKPITNDDDLTLITNSDDDTVIIKILRDILRSLIALPNNISNLINSLSVQVDGFENTVNVVNQSGLPDLSALWTYSNNDFDDDLINFSIDIAEVQHLPVTYLTNINENPLMPEKMLNDKDNLTVNIPNMSGFTVFDDGKSFSTQTTSYVITSNDYPWLDPLVKKIKRFSGILLILGYLVSLRYRLPEIVRGE